MTMKLKSDEKKCVGCMLCTIACSAKHLKTFNPDMGRCAVEDTFPEPAEYHVHHCIQCDEHPCVDSCPEEAIVLNDKLGIYVVDWSKCTGCGNCVEVCPYEGCWLSPNEKSLKCDLCGGNPECVQVCPKGVFTLEK